jgi:hypothetical protein
VDAKDVPVDHRRERQTVKDAVELFPHLWPAHKNKEQKKKTKHKREDSNRKEKTHLAWMLLTEK